MGKLTPKSVGVTNITLKTSYNNATTQKSFAVFVYPNADIIFEKTQINLFLKGESTTKLQFELFIGDSTIAENDLSSITYSVKDPTICEINANAEITAKSFGETSVVVNYNGFEAGVSVSVYNEEVLVSSIEDLKGVQDRLKQSLGKESEEYLEYKYRKQKFLIELDFDGTREQKLPVVKNVIINTIVREPFSFNDTIIDNEAFNHCQELKYVTLPETLTSIGDYAFSECRNLESVSLPNSILSIGNNAFFMCKICR